MIDQITHNEAFTEVAAGYDAAFSRLPSVILLRERIYNLIRRHFPSSGTVLDLACGTGEDAMLLAKRGLRVVGGDASLGMLSEAAAKSWRSMPSPSFVRLNAGSLSMFRDSSFDAVLSNFGGLNCVADLGVTLGECHRVLRPDGVMLLCLIGAHSIWESAAFAARGQWRKSTRRRTDVPVTVRVGAHHVRTWFHSVRAVRRSTAGFFNVIDIAGLNIIAPPPSSQTFMKKNPSLTASLYSLDRLVQSVPGVRALGDHVVFVLRRRAIA